MKIGMHNLEKKSYKNDEIENSILDIFGYISWLKESTAMYCISF